MQHITVLQTETKDALALDAASTVVDCTVGSGGHAALLIPLLGPKGHYIAIDQDPTALEATRKRLGTTTPKLTLELGNFKNITELVQKQGVLAVDAILADLGWRIEQFDGSSGVPRGFSFQHDEPLKMTYGDPDTYPFTAYDIVNEWEEEDIANVLYGYGEERFARRIAKHIAEKRAEAPISTSSELAAVIEEAVPVWYRHKRGHPATKSFQALRIAVNDELDVLTTLIADGFELLRPGGRLAIITFHSIEDRIVKTHFKNLVRDQRGVLVSKKPISASREEVLENPRARSAQLRVIEKL
jgi:16S rRNA (cytosine1402-N4)-methyltransferase